MNLPPVSEWIEPGTRLERISAQNLISPNGRGGTRRRPPACVSWRSTTPPGRRLFTRPSNRHWLPPPSGLSRTGPGPSPATRRASTDGWRSITNR
eukprot:1189669-Prorocentrum_minimum.AAC.3